MTDDIVTRLREHCDTIHIPNLSCDWLGEKCSNCQAADEIERLREWNLEVTKLLQQAQKCMDIWQKSEDELIEFHNGRAIKQLTKQADEIERLRKELRYKCQLLDLYESRYPNGPVQDV